MKQHCNESELFDLVIVVRYTHEQEMKALDDIVG